MNNHNKAKESGATNTSATHDRIRVLLTHCLGPKEARDDLIHSLRPWLRISLPHGTFERLNTIFVEVYYYIPETL